MTTGHVHLFRRGAVYQWRRRLPPVIVSILGRSHFSKSLNTSDLKLARIRARRLSAMLDHSLRHLFNTLSKRQKIGADDVVRSIMGHASQHEMSAIYFHDYESKQTADVLLKIDVVIDLSHLYIENQPHPILFFLVAARCGRQTTA